jgi:hypothetical protein
MSAAFDCNAVMLSMGVGTSRPTTHFDRFPLICIISENPRKNFSEIFLRILGIVEMNFFTSLLEGGTHRVLQVGVEKFPDFIPVWELWGWDVSHPVP